LRKRGLASNSISTTFNGIFHFYDRCNFKQEENKHVQARITT
jgi:hypothetical protein